MPNASIAPSPRTALDIAFDIGDVGLHICALSDELKLDGSNLAYIARRVEAEMKWLGQLLADLDDRLARDRHQIRTAATVTLGTARKDLI